MTRNLARLAAISLCISACTPERPVPGLDLAATLPDVAAEFRTETAGHEEQKRTATWRYWREGKELITENPEDRTGERWQLDGKTLFYSKLWHDDQMGIALRADDLGVRDAAPAWAQQTLLVNPGVLKALRQSASGWRGDVPYRRYEGEVDGVSWSITMRVDLMVPLKVERIEKGDRHVTTLAEVHALADAPWKPTPSRSYELIDYADLGDRATDPFVMKVQGQLGMDHAH